MYYGLTIKWDRKKNYLEVVSGIPIFEKSVAVHRLTLLSDIPVSNIVEATFATYDEETKDYEIITAPQAMMQSGIEEYTCPIPDLVIAVAGAYIVSFAEKTPVEVDGEIKYAVLTTGQAVFYVGESSVNASQTPIDPTTADRLQAEINELAARITHLENANVRKVLVDFSVNADTGEGIKYYSDGTTAKVQYPTAGGSSEVRNWIKILSFDTSAWASGEVAFGSLQTGFFNPDYLVYLESSGTEIYDSDTEITPTEKSGYHRLSDTIFKGTDGSLLLTSNSPYSGRLLLMGNGAASGNFIVSVDFSERIMTVTYADGTTEQKEVPYLTESEGNAKYQSKEAAEKFEENIRSLLTWKIIK